MPQDKVRPRISAFWRHLFAGVSFQTMRHPRTRATYTVVSNNPEGAWPLARFLYGLLAG